MVNLKWRNIFGYGCVIVGASGGILFYLISREKPMRRNAFEEVIFKALTVTSVGLSILCGGGIGGFLGGGLLCGDVSKGISLAKKVTLSMLVIMLVISFIEQRIEKWKNRAKWKKFYEDPGVD